jgi:hypothetical protein
VKPRNSLSVKTCSDVVFGMIPERVPQKYMPF